MKIELHRRKLTAKATLGDLFVDGVFECHTLEDVVRLNDPTTPQNEGAKVWGATAIPAGVYKVIINLSQRFKRLMMRLLNVPDFTGILIHGGNTAEDTHGCILVGQELAGETIKAGTSTPAVKALQAKVQAALDRGEEVTIAITNDFLEAAHV